MTSANDNPMGLSIGVQTTVPLSEGKTLVRHGSIVAYVMLLGTWPTFFFLFLSIMYLYDHLTSIHMTAYLYIRALLLGTSLFSPFVRFLLFSPYGSL